MCDITYSRIVQGYEVLTELEKAIEAGKKGAALADLSSKFYTIIPHDFGRRVRLLFGRLLPCDSLWCAGRSPRSSAHARRWTRRSRCLSYVQSRALRFFCLTSCFCAQVLGDIEIAQKLLENQADDSKAEEIDHPDDTNYKSLKCGLAPLDRKSREFEVCMHSILPCLHRADHPYPRRLSTRTSSRPWAAATSSCRRSGLWTARARCVRGLV